MKRWVILWIIMQSVLSGYAQKGMHVDALFESRFKHDKRAVEVLTVIRSNKIMAGSFFILKLFLYFIIIAFRSIPGYQFSYESCQKQLGPQNHQS